MYKLRIITLFIFSLFFSSCSKRFIGESTRAPSDSSIYIEMPDNKLVFENISSIIYEAISRHYNRVGYKISSTRKDSYVLKTLIKKIDSSHKFLSPDLLTYSTKMRVDLFCELLDEKNVSVAKKVFSFTTLLSKAKDYVANSKFTEFEYKRLFENNIYKIDHYFRKYFLEKENKK